MKFVGIVLLMLLAGFLMLAMALPGISLNTKVLYTRSAVQQLEKLRLEAAKGDVSQAASALKSVVEFSPSKVNRQQDLAQIFEASRASVIREIISRMQSLTGEDLGDDPKLWIEKYYRKKSSQPLQ